MIVTMHGFSTMHSNLRTDIHIISVQPHNGIQEADTLSALCDRRLKSRSEQAVAGGHTR